MVIDSREWWTRAYGSARASSGANEPSDFALDVAARLTCPSEVLELGCGPGWDGAHFARAGHRVVASDFVQQDAAWKLARRGMESRLDFVLLDLRSPLPFREAAFDVVYARLCLHYFSTDVTKRIFGEIHRVLRDGGIFAFLCKSTRDPGYGRGEPVGPDMFRINEKIYHFFDTSFALDCLGNRFKVEELWGGPARLSGESSDVVRVRASKFPTSPDEQTSNIT